VNDKVTLCGCCHGKMLLFVLTAVRRDTDEHAGDFSVLVSSTGLLLLIV